MNRPHAITRVVQFAIGFLLVAAVAAWPFVYGAPHKPVLPVSATTSCPAGGYCVELQWTNSTSQAACVSPCTFGYNVLRGTTAGGESSTPINASPAIGGPYFDPLVLGAAPGTYFYVVQALETSGGLTQTASSAEVSVTFPAAVQAPTNPAVSLQ